MKKAKTATMLAILCAFGMLAGCGTGGGSSEMETSESNVKEDEGTVSELDAVYLGVENYGAEETNRENKNNFTYRFEINGAEKVFKLWNGTADEEGNYDYPLQNQLKEGYSYRVTVENDTVMEVSEKADSAEIDYTAPVSGVPGERTLKNFLQTALAPVGTTLYIYGGGWDWQDEGSAIQTRTLGVSQDWIRFFNSQDENYTFKEKDGDEAKADPKTSYYPYGEYNEYYYAGLDCSGYLGWVIYNTFESESGKNGYVGGSTGFAKRLSAKGWGEWTQDIQVPDGKNGYTMLPGDVMSINGHVWVSLGTCEDGSVVILHSTPSVSRTGQPGGGVQISAIGADKNCEAYKLADEYMSKYYPEWYERYQTHLCDPARYFGFEGENAGRFTWNTEGTADGLADPENLQEMTPEEVLAVSFGEAMP